jgi:DNA-binding winged helix-turn-helix (wHTH) protein
MTILNASQFPQLAFGHADRFTPEHGAELRHRSFRFGPFLLQPERQLLLKLHAPVRIGGRALDLLTLLAERAGELVSKPELVARAWPETFVDESNLKVNIAGLRRALGDAAAAPRFIATVAGRGYRFVAPVEFRGTLASAPATASISGKNPNEGARGLSPSALDGFS